MQMSTTDLGSVRALLFDLGGVVIDLDFDRAFRFWADRASCAPAALAQRFAFDEAYEQHERGELDASGYFSALRRRLGVRLSDDDLVAGWNEIYIGPVPGAATMLTGGPTIPAVRVHELEPHPSACVGHAPRDRDLELSHRVRLVRAPPAQARS
jgi:hypothetical protein